MPNVMTVSESELVASWRRFRLELISSSDSKEEKLQKIVEFWSSIPRVSRTIDYYTPESWPTPWEIIHDQLYCESGVSLLMYYTVKLIPELNELPISCYVIDDGSDEFLIFAHGEYVLNYTPYRLVSIDEVKKNVKITHWHKSHLLPEIV